MAGHYLHLSYLNCASECNDTANTQDTNTHPFHIWYHHQQQGNDSSCSALILLLLTFVGSSICCLSLFESLLCWLGWLAIGKVTHWLIGRKITVNDRNINGTKDMKIIYCYFTVFEQQMEHGEGPYLYLSMHYSRRQSILWGLNEILFLYLFWCWHDFSPYFVILAWSTGRSH